MSCSVLQRPHESKGPAQEKARLSIKKASTTIFYPQVHRGLQARIPHIYHTQLALYSLSGNDSYPPSGICSLYEISYR